MIFLSFMIKSKKPSSSFYSECHCCITHCISPSSRICNLTHFRLFKVIFFQGFLKKNPKSIIDMWLKVWVVCVKWLKEMLWWDTSSSSCKAINLSVVLVEAKFDKTTQTLIHILVQYVKKTLRNTENRQSICPKVIFWVQNNCFYSWNFMMNNLKLKRFWPAYLCLKFIINYFLVDVLACRDHGQSLFSWDNCVS